MNKSSYLFPFMGAVSILVLFLSLITEPTSYLHEYYLIASRHLSEGLIPWLGFDLKEMPLGIEILRIIPNNENSSFYARVLVLLFNFINIGILGAILKKIGLSGQCTIIGCILYLALLSPFGNLGVTLEPFGMTFLLLGYYGFLSHKKSKNLIAGILFAIAFFFKFDFLYFLPCFALLILLPTYRHHLHISRTFFFVLIIAFSILIGYMLITILSENTDWITSIDINPLNESHQIISWILLLFSSGILILIPLQKSMGKGLSTNLNKSAWLSLFILLILMIAGCNRSCIQIIIPINVIAISKAIQNNWDKKNVRKIYYIGILLSLMSNISILIFAHKLDNENPLIESFEVNYQLQQEIKLPVHLEEMAPSIDENIE